MPAGLDDLPEHAVLHPLLVPPFHRVGGHAVHQHREVEVVASGQADVWIEPSAKPWDLCPMKVIVEEAGGKFFNFEGTSSIYAGNALVCTPAFEPLLRSTFVK